MKEVQEDVVREKREEDEKKAVVVVPVADVVA